MRRMILRMIATGSLSAFSSATLPTLPSQASRGAGEAVAGPVRQARASEAQPQVQPPPRLSLEQGKPAALPTGRVPPRGSLLDLSV
jgi:hypothetical protein